MPRLNEEYTRTGVILSCVDDGGEELWWAELNLDDQKFGLLAIGQSRQDASDPHPEPEAAVIYAEKWQLEELVMRLLAALRANGEQLQ
jgi:hypothetical protein